MHTHTTLKPNQLIHINIMSTRVGVLGTQSLIITISFKALFGPYMYTHVHIYQMLIKLKPNLIISLTTFNAIK